MRFIETHAHIDGEEFNQDRAEVIQRARDAGCKAILVPAIDLPSSQRILTLCEQYPDYLYPMVGLHPEEVKGDWREQLAKIRELLRPYLPPKHPEAPSPHICAIGEVGLDFYWSREFEKEQQEAFEEQVRWSVESGLPLMIHCRKAQNEMVAILKRYANDLPGGVFHCFTGNELEARELLQFPRFVLGIGGVLTFKKSRLPETLAGGSLTTGPAATPVVPLSRIVLETDAPYMAPVPMRGQRNEPVFITYVIKKLAEAYGVSEEEVGRQTSENAARIFGVK